MSGSSSLSLSLSLFICMGLDSYFAPVVFFFSSTGQLPSSGNPISTLSSVSKVRRAGDAGSSPALSGLSLMSPQITQT